MNVLFVCTGNVARSPMAEAIFRELVGPGDQHVARSAGTGTAATRRLTTRDLAWADVVAVMEPGHVAEVAHHWPDHARKVRVLGVPDDYDPEEPELRKVLIAKVKALLLELERCPAGGPGTRECDTGRSRGPAESTSNEGRASGIGRRSPFAAS